MSATSAAAEAGSGDWLTPRRAAWVFLAFALAYFISTLIRAITATLSPSLGAELALNASDLGLLAGGYFFGFAMTQLPLGRWLDRHGPRRVILAFLGFAVVGCAAFALATSFAGLLAARVLTGMGVSACLMAPLTGFRRWLSPVTLLRVNSWMLMTGSLGMVAATLPVQWLLPMTGWRGLFWMLAALVLLAMLVLALVVPRWGPAAAVAGSGHPLTNQMTQVKQMNYGQIASHPFFRQMVPIGFVNYGGMVAMQTLWAGPWMVQVAGYSGGQAAFGLFGINLCMLVTFSLWGWVTPHLARRRWPAERMIAYGLPLSLCVLTALVILGPRAGWPAWALFCVCSSFVSLAQPAVAQALPAPSAGRALSAYNLVLFAGIFAVQWGVGVLVDAFGALGWSTVASFQGAMAVFGLCCLWAYSVFLRGYRRHAAMPQD